MMPRIRTCSRPSTLVLLAMGFLVASTSQWSWSQAPKGDPEGILKLPQKIVDDIKEVNSRSKPVDGDDAHQALLRLRLGAAAREADLRFQVFDSGFPMRPAGVLRREQPYLLQLMAAVHAVAEAERALVDNAADRIASLDRLVTMAQWIEQVTKIRSEVGQVLEQDWLLSRQFLANCELAAIDARRNPPKSAPKRSYPPPTSGYAPAATEGALGQFTAALRQLAMEEPQVAPGLADTERKKLLLEQRAALARAPSLQVQVMNGGGRETNIGAAVNLLLGNELLPILSKNELALDDRPSNQLRIAERDLVLATMLEAITKKLFDRRAIAQQDFECRRNDRLSAELKLLELRQAFPGVAPSKAQTIESRPAASKRAAEPDPLAFTAAEQIELSRLVVTEGGLRRVNLELRLPIASLQPAPDDDEWRKLAKSRHAWATSELQSRLHLFCTGSVDPTGEDLVPAVRRYEGSALALAKDSSERIAIIECASRLFRVAEFMNSQRVSVGTISMNDLWICQVARLDTQIRLLDLRRK